MRFNFFITVIAALLPAVLSAEEGTGRQYRDFYFVRSISPWLSSVNAAGLHTLVPGRISVAGAGFEKADGALIGTEGSDDSWEAGAFTESYVRVSPKIAFSGRLSYSNFRGRNMGGPVFMDPSYNPVNFYESTDTTTGVKTRELYTLSGGIAYAFDGRWSIGGKVDYQTGNCAKRKDPRFLNSWSDIFLSAGGRFVPSGRFSAGVAFIYRKTLETVTGSIYGTSDKQYYILVDYGGFWGKREQFGSDNGYISTSDSRPMYNSFYGAALQLDFGRSDAVRFFSELSWMKRNGYYGERGSSSVTYTEHSGHVFRYSGVLTAASGRAVHRVSLDLEYSPLKNYENIYRETTVQGQSPVVEYFGKNKVLDRNTAGLSLSYAGYLGLEDHRPEWEYGASVTAGLCSFTAVSYPFYRHQDVVRFSGELFGKKNVTVRKNILSVSAGCGYAAGSGTENRDGEYVTSTSEHPFSGDAYLHRDFEYRTAGRVSVSLAFRYTRMAGKGIAVYFEAGDRFTRAVEEPVYLHGASRNVFTLSLGCFF